MIPSRRRYRIISMTVEPYQGESIFNVARNLVDLIKNNDIYAITIIIGGQRVNVTSQSTVSGITKQFLTKASGG